ncbi:hypothetical protein [Clostridium sp.]|uniref:hypothetical protein n=1 Tax=Clostridium sp. TaxID=1506 RepID=UPI00261B8CED|nr:hypothetical protein [Clostridium sp.]
MEEKSILIQSDEVTKNIMSEIQDDMINLISKVSRNMSEEFVDKLKPVEKKISDLKGNFQEFQEEEFEEKLEELNNSIQKITKSIQTTIDEAIKKSLVEQNKVLFESIEERLAILGLKVVKDAANNRETILSKIDEIHVDKIEEKVESVEKSLEGKVDALEESIEGKVQSLERSIGNNIDSSKSLILGKIKIVDDKIQDKDIIIDLINKLENELNEKIEYIQEEVEWGNKSFFARLFGKRR